MWTLEHPKISLDDTYSACISRIRSDELRERLEDAFPFIETAAIEYSGRGQAATLHLIQPDEFVDGDISTDEMVKIYDGRMAKASGPGRPYYDHIKSLAVNEICPLCGHRQVKTLDHVLPKRRFPVFAVTPINLVPACSDCNKSKSVEVADDPEDVFLHPYFDNIEHDLWLRATIREEKPAVALFQADPPAAWTPVLAARTKNHFRRLGLARLYSQESAQEMTNIRGSLQDLYDVGGANLVRAHLERETVSRIDVNTNSWRSALYAALAASDWYVDEGFQMP